MASVHNQTFFKRQISQSETWREDGVQDGRVAVLSEEYEASGNNRFVTAGFNSLSDMKNGAAPAEKVTRRLYNQAEAAVNHWLKFGTMPEDNGRW